MTMIRSYFRLSPSLAPCSLRGGLPSARMACRSTMFVLIQLLEACQNRFCPSVGCAMLYPSD